MTLDVCIGKVVIENIENKPVLSVNSCPKSIENVCDINATLWPDESYRSGSREFREFWYNCVGDLYYQLREHPKSNDVDIAYIKPYLNKIISLSDECNYNYFDIDRMKWLKYWCKVAVELYDDEAGICFS